MKRLCNVFDIYVGKVGGLQVDKDKEMQCIVNLIELACERRFRENGYGDLLCNCPYCHKEEDSIYNYCALTAEGAIFPKDWEAVE